MTKSTYTDIVQKDNRDWRVQDYDGFLNGNTFKLKKFRSTETDDHEHCVFCWQKITDLDIDGADAEGYCTLCPNMGQ